MVSDSIDFTSKRMFAVVAGVLHKKQKMSLLQESRAVLRISGDDLCPDEISALLGHEPTTSKIKGEKIVGKKSGRIRYAKTGSWILEARHAEPGNIEQQVKEILEKLTPDIEQWNRISETCSIDIFFGLFMSTSNDGEELSSECLLALGKRKIKVLFDIYSPDEN